ncbi:MAG TPA: universal stress protein [Polyangiaceae bacterium]|nr:universal stress protein [Polyangiaceae bacterium]
MDDFKHILAPTDFEPASAGALQLATSLAAEFGAKITLLHVWEISLYPYMDSSMNTEIMYRIEQAAKDQLAASLAQVQLLLPNAEARLEIGLPAPTILEMIPKLGVDLVVLGTHGRHGLSHTLLGSVAEQVVRASQVPVFTVHTQPATPSPSSS